MKNHFVVIDTNVLVSGLISSNPSSPTSEILNYLLANKGIITPLYNSEIYKEYKDVLHRPKFNFDPSTVDDILERVQTIGISCDRKPSKESFPDPKDVVFYEVALSKEDSFLVTGNIKHFPEVDFVVTPAELVEIIKRNLRLGMEQTNW